jgi:leucyl/phenylalanyl-tRNA--protein transferase
MNGDIQITPSILLRAYSVGIFPMAGSADDDTLAWFDPDPRGILPLDKFHLSRRLARTVRTTGFTVTSDTDFAAVIDGCAGNLPHPTQERATTWINGRIRTLCLELHRMGYAHSIEVWDGSRLVGGLYGVALGAAFFGESMFSTARDASKIAFVHLVAGLKKGGFALLDTQFATEHLRQFGVIEIPRSEYRARLTAAIANQGDFQWAGGADAAVSLAQSMTPIS